MKRLLCIDYGEKHIGIAMATTPIAEPVATLSQKQAILVLQQLVADENIEGLVVGVSEGLMAEKTKAFGDKLGERLNLPVFFQDETLSSHEVRKDVAQAGLKKSRREAKIDHLVAARILQDYIDTNSTLDSTK